jgi:hypothetical protein
MVSTKVATAVCRFALPLALCLAAGCASVALTPGAEKIRVAHHPDDVAPCKVLGNIKLEPMPLLSPRQIERRLQNAAYGLGANAVIQTFEETHSGTEKLQGIGYLCDEPAPPPPAAKPHS